jgi:Ca-activated chloride channel homolog
VKQRKFEKFSGKIPVAAIFAILLILSGCSLPQDGQGEPDAQGDFGDTGGCTPVLAAVSPEKVNLFTELSEQFADSAEAESLANCAVIQPYAVSSGEASRLLRTGWSEGTTASPRPVIWSPASSIWVNQVADSQGDALVPDPVSFARTPVVLAMPERMATAMGWPEKDLGLSDVRSLCLDPKGWGRYGGAIGLWGDFKLGKTNPNSSTTGLNTLLMQNYAASGKKAGLTTKDITKGTRFAQDLESCVIHYGDTTGNVLRRIYDRDQNGESLNYVSAVAVEETSVINYNLGNPTSGVITEDMELEPPSEKLVAIYPKEGSLVSDNPIVVMGDPADWVSDEQREAAEAFQKFALTNTAQELLGDYGFRAADSKIKPSGLVSTEYGADPNKPTTYLEKPSVSVVSAALRQWESIRKPSSVLLLMDVSGSMADDSGTGQSRMTEAINGAVGTLDHFRPTDELGVWVFTTGIESGVGENIVELRSVSPLAGDAENLAREIKNLTPQEGTPLYDSIDTAFKYMYARADVGRINAIVVLSDGEDTDSFTDIEELKRALRGPAERTDPLQVRVFPIVYGSADKSALTDIAEASGGQVFDASDPRRLSLVFTSVMNNF